ncbi:alpha/beta hydrolase [Sinosporangium siamense]|uniref:Peptidase n=1 Tax=Sinosporangium siamense TaxID=1367973 RepID=A0A919RDS3_9ACTN|nr:alpha/beta hydrolase [Sinosporangium siamense]GII90569.1 peptidase [Sinosporangium siamense]
MKKTITTVLCAGLLATLAAASPAAAKEGLSWRDCGDGLQCAELQVPVHWGDPRGKEITLGLAKLPAKDPATRKGTLFINMGGPAQQISVLRQTKDSFADLTQWFDVVTSDPRGFEASTEVKCPTSYPIPEDVEWVMPDRATYEAYRADNRRFGEGCAEAAGPLAGRLNSWQVVRDMDAIRGALGEAKLNYFGNSYGTVVGQIYAGTFPDRVGRMYLDSVLDHTDTSWIDWLTPQAKTQEGNLRRFAAWCAGTASCALHGKDLLKVWDEVMARAARRPIPAPGAGAKVTVRDTLIASRSPVAFESAWPGLAKALAGAHAGDATLFAKFPAGAPDPALSRVMYCADFPYPTKYREVKGLERRLRAVAPRIGWTSAWVMAMHCGGLPKTTTYPPRPINPRGLPPILVANGDYDHATPPAHGRRVAAALKSARYLPAKGGHALYWSGHPCVRKHVNTYLTTGNLPAKGTTCGPASS